MRIINFGSLNIDRVYNVPHFVQAGETILSTGYEVFSGGKGLNQSVALARAGAEAYHAGAVGFDGGELAELLARAGVHTTHLLTLNEVSGHAIIQLNPAGQNCIIVFPGANHSATPEYIDNVLAQFAPGDMLLVQNETSCVAHAMEKAHALGIRVAFNPSPVTGELYEYPLHLVDVFILNEVEGMVLSGTSDKDFTAILYALGQKFPKAAIVLTAGKSGAFYQKGDVRLQHGIYDVPVVDTTAAGDTFCGFFLAGMAKGLPPEKTLEYASRASSIAVGKKGAAGSIPNWEEMLAANLRPE